MLMMLEQFLEFAIFTLIVDPIVDSMDFTGVKGPMFEWLCHVLLLTGCPKMTCMVLCNANLGG